MGFEGKDGSILIHKGEKNRKEFEAKDKHGQKP